MTLSAVYAHVSCRDLAASTPWYAALFARNPDAAPMPGLAEWHPHRHSGLQLFEDEGRAGHSTLTLVVTRIEEEHARLEQAGLEPGPLEHGTPALVRLRDPDGNLVVLAQGSDVTA